MFFFLCTHRFASARHRTPSWSPHIARTSQWQRVANASGLLASAHFSARLRSSAGTPGVAGWRFSSTARDRKREQKGKKKGQRWWGFKRWWDGWRWSGEDNLVGPKQRWKRWVWRWDKRGETEEKILFSFVLFHAEDLELRWGDRRS